MTLSDRDLAYLLGLPTFPTDVVDTTRLRHGSMSIDPTPTLEALQTASVDVRLGKHFQRYKNGFGPIDASVGVRPEDLEEETREDYVTIRAGEFLLGHTIEYVKLPSNVSANVDGRSSIGRLGVAVHVTAGFIDPGFEGQITLEIKNHLHRDVRIPIGMRVAQLVFSLCNTPARRPYGSEGLGSRYQGQTGAQPYAKESPSVLDVLGGDPALTIADVEKAVQLVRIAREKGRPIHVGEASLHVAWALVRGGLMENVSNGMFALAPDR